MKRVLRFGYDFHGTLVDAQPIKVETAWRLFQKRIPARLLKSEIALAQKILTKRQYAKLRDTVFEEEDVFLEAEPHADALETIERLEAEGHQQQIITASDPAAFRTVMRWCVYQDAIRKTDLLTKRIPLTSVGRNNPKTEPARGLDVYVSNDLEDLRPLVGVVPILILLDRPYNTHEDESGVAERVNNFSDFYLLVHALAS